MTAIASRAPTRLLVLLTLIAVVAVLLLASAVAAGASAGVGPDDGTATATYTVRPGDTLWDVARSHTAPGHDVRRTVFEIQARSGLAGSLIRPGDVLVVPATG